MSKYAIGVDYGTQSGRAVLAEIGTGREIASEVFFYPHGVMDERLPDGRPLPPDWALEHPQDYLDVLSHTIPALLKASGVDPRDAIGIGLDVTASTFLPVKADSTPLCFLGEFEDEPHAYMKLWKHHAAQDQANRITALAEERGEKFLARYGGKISSEWYFPKILQILEEKPEVYDAADTFVEAVDWLVWILTGQLTRNSCCAGYKALWHKEEGFPEKDFFAALHPRLADFFEEKMYSGRVSPLGEKAGELSERAARWLGLAPGTAVAVGNVDAHVAVPAVGIHESGKLLMIVGTSICHILCGDTEEIVPGMCGVVEDGVLAGKFGYEAGQCCVGDHFEWFITRCVPEAYTAEARNRGLSIHQLLREKAEKLKIGESGLIALDWWNGNRSMLVDYDLSGLILGMSLTTRPEEIYRALIEATAFGTRMIVDNFTEHGVPVDELYACGGISHKDPMMMQIYADVTGREIRIGASTQTPALGSAIHGAVAAGCERGGYDTVAEAAVEMGRVLDTVYRPIPENVKAYEALYQEYKALHDYFGRGGSDVMKRLKAIRESAKA